MDSSTKLKEQLNRIAILLLWTYESNNFILKAAVEEFEWFKQSWGSFAIESVDSSFQKVIKKGSFPSEDAVGKALYLRITELYKKWNGRTVSNWALVRNQFSMDDKIQDRILKYENF